MGRKVFHAESWPQARQVVEVLARVGIPSHIEASAGGAEAAQTGIGPEVWLAHADQHDRARSAVSDFLCQKVPTAIELCRHCDEENPTALHRCWACGQPLATRRLLLPLSCSA